MIYAGGGIIASGASEQLRELVAKTGIPVAMTVMGLGAFPASHELSLGMMGMHGEAWVNHAIQEADLLALAQGHVAGRLRGGHARIPRQHRLL